MSDSQKRSSSIVTASQVEISLGSGSARALDGSSARLAAAGVPEDATVISYGLPLAGSGPARPTSPYELGKMLAGERLHHYVLQEYIGGGGMGAVFRAHDTTLNRDVAIKVLSRDQGADEEMRRRFQNEAQSAARLDHPNIARVYYVGEDQGLNYIVFEFILGTNVKELVDRGGVLAAHDAISYTLQIAEALSHASERDVVHRDIKPSNILITSDGRAKLVDMGLARLHQVQAPGDDLTASGVTLGTFDYISPEQARDPRTADVRSDLYSLGCTLYFMLTGRPPFPEGTVLQKLLQHQGDEPPDPREFNPRLPEPLSVILRRLMAKDPRHRFQTPQELIDELLLLAELLGLRSPNWGGRALVAPLAPPVVGWERHLPWMVPVVALLCIVLALDLISTFSPTGAGPATVAELDRRLEDPSDVAATTKDRTSTGTSARVSETGTDRVADRDQTSAAGSMDNGDSIPATVTEGTAARAGSTPGDNPSRATASGSGQVRAAESPSQADTDTQNGGAKATGNSNKTAAGDSQSPDTIPKISATDRIDTARLSVTDGAGTGLSIQNIEPGDELSALSAASAVALQASLAASNATAETPSAARIKAAEVPTTPAPMTSAPMATEATPGAPMPMPPRPGVRIVDTVGVGEQHYATLRAAALAAKNGDVIELRYNGRSLEEPLELNNLKVTIRAGQDASGKSFQPVVRFRPSSSDRIKRSMITVAGGRLTLVQLAMELELPRDVPAESWSMFETQRAEGILLENCSLTIRNAQNARTAYHQNVSFFNAKAALGTDTMMMPGQAPASDPVIISLKNCIARGEAALVRAEDQQPVKINWDNGLVALTEPLLIGMGGAATPRPEARLQLELRHVTAALHGGLVRLTNSDDARYLLNTEITCTDSILWTGGAAPLVEQFGVNNAREFQAQLKWNGDRNFYEGFGTFWSIRGGSPLGSVQQQNFDDWRAWWTTRQEILPHANSVVWAELPAADRQVHTSTVADYSLADIAQLAREGAQNGDDAGFDAAALPTLPSTPVTSPTAADAVPDNASSDGASSGGASSGKATASDPQPASGFTRQPTDD